MNRPTLFRRLFVAYAVVLTLAAAALILLPVTVSEPASGREIVVIIVGVVAMLAVHRFLLLRTLAPLDRLTQAMRRVDPLAPGERVPTGNADAEVTALTDAFNDMLDRLEGERRESGRRALAAQEAERQRVARELHDEIGQQLTGILLRSETLARRAPADLKADMEGLREASRSAAEEVRVIAQRLRPEALDELGLTSALLALCGAMEQRPQITVDRHFDSHLELTAEEELVTYRVAQEALTNVARHANARTVSVALTQDESGRPTLSVRDDGDGLSPGLDRATNGIRGMRERAMLVGAALELGAAPQSGTELRLILPPR